MSQVVINFWAVIAAAVSNMILGAVWYSPALFATQWMRLIGKSKEDIMKEGPGKAYGQAFVCALVTAYVFAHFIGYAGASTAVQGLQAGFWAWLGFVATTTAAMSIFEKRSWKLYAINNGYNLVSLMIMGVILALWK